MMLTIYSLLLFTALTLNGIKGNFYSFPKSQQFRNNILSESWEVGDEAIPMNLQQTPCRNKDKGVNDQKKDLWWTLPIPPMELDGQQDKPIAVKAPQVAKIEVSALHQNYTQKSPKQQQQHQHHHQQQQQQQQQQMLLQQQQQQQQQMQQLQQQTWQQPQQQTWQQPQQQMWQQPQQQMWQQSMWQQPQQQTQQPQKQTQQQPQKPLQQMQQNVQPAPTSTAKAIAVVSTPQVAMNVQATTASSKHDQPKERTKVHQIQKASAQPLTQPAATIPLPSQIVVSNKENSSLQYFANKSAATIKSSGGRVPQTNSHSSNKQRDNTRWIIGP